MKDRQVTFYFFAVGKDHAKHLKSTLYPGGNGYEWLDCRNKQGSHFRQKISFDFKYTWE